MASSCYLEEFMLMLNLNYLQVLLSLSLLPFLKLIKPLIFSKFLYQMSLQAHPQLCQDNLYLSFLRKAFELMIFSITIL